MVYDIENSGESPLIIKGREWRVVALSLLSFRLFSFRCSPHEPDK